MAITFDFDNASGTWGHFNQQAARPMGLGILASNQIVFKRKFRWTMLIRYCVVDANNFRQVPEEFVKIGSRPQLDIEETEINYLHGKFWLPGKVTFQTMTVTYYDVAGTVSADTYDGTATTFDGDNTLSCLNDASLTDGLARFIPGGGDGSTKFTSIFEWIASVYDITDPCVLQMGSALSDYQGEALIRLYDGCGRTIEAWILGNMWPQSVNFGELDMSSSEEVTVELTLRYSNVAYRSFCPNQTIERCPCTPCV